MKPKFLSVLLVLGMALCLAKPTEAQNKVGIKTNVLHDATASVNLSVEYAFVPKWSFEVGGYWHPSAFNVFGNAKLNHWIVMPEVKFWFCERFQGAFIGAHFLGGQIYAGQFPIDFSKRFDRGVNFNTYILDAYRTLGGGISFGYDFVLGRHWNIELELGVGYVDAHGNEFQDGVEIYHDYHHDYVGPTKLGVSFVYLF